MMSVFDRAFAVVVGVEGGFSSTPSDAGNWTGGAEGRGLLRGTKYGISAASYPSKDIANLTLDQAKAIYLTDYWLKVRADALPPPLALLAFDAAVNDGPGRAAKWLQAAAGVTQDGQIGPQTMTALQRRTLAALMIEFHAQRTLWQLTLPKAAIYGLGWARRLATVYLAAQAMEGLTPETPQASAPAAPTAPPPAPSIPCLPVHPAAPAAPVRPAPPAAPCPPPSASDAEVAITEALNERSLTDALNARP